MRLASCRDITNASLTFIDASPGYLPTPMAACRIAASFPDARRVGIHEAST